MSDRMCGETLVSAVSHESCCARGESTRGHYSVVNAVADGTSVVDPSLQTEVRGLCDSSERPADVLTAPALPGVLTALDVAIASQEAVLAGLGACTSAYRRKVRRYSRIIPQLRQARTTPQPMVWIA